MSGSSTVIAGEMWWQQSHPQESTWAQQINLILIHIKQVTHQNVQ